MRFLSRLFGGSPQRGTVEAFLLEGDSIVEVVGESHYQSAIRSVCGSSRWEGVRHSGCIAALVAEPSNRYDPNAVMVQIDGQLVGYLSRGDAIDYGPVVQRFAANGKASRARR